MGFSKDFSRLLDQLRVFFRQVLFLADIGIQVEELDRAVEVSLEVPLERLPFTEARGPLASLLVEFPVEVIMLRLLFSFSQESRQEADAIYGFGGFNACQRTGGWQEIPMS